MYAYKTRIVLYCSLKVLQIHRRKNLKKEILTYLNHTLSQQKFAQVNDT